MKTLVIYDSFFGNTKQIADAVATKLGADVRKCSDVDFDTIRSYELLIVGSPIRGWRPSDNIVKFLVDLKAGYLAGIKATSFDTRVRLFIHGDAKDKIAKELKRAGAEIIAQPEAFYVTKSEGPLESTEVEKAIAWAEKIK